MPQFTKEENKEQEGLGENTKTATGEDSLEERDKGTPKTKVNYELVMSAVLAKTNDGDVEAVVNRIEEDLTGKGEEEAPDEERVVEPLMNLNVEVGESIKHATLEDLMEEEEEMPDEERVMEPLMKLNVEVGEKLKTGAIIDTRATHSCIDHELYEKLAEIGGVEGELPVSKVKLITAVERRRVKIHKQVMFDIVMESRKYRVMAFVIRNLFTPMLLGLNWLREYKVQIDCERSMLSTREMLNI